MRLPARQGITGFVQAYAKKFAASSGGTGRGEWEGDIQIRGMLEVYEAGLFSRDCLVGFGLVVS